MEGGLFTLTTDTHTVSEQNFCKTYGFPAANEKERQQTGLRKLVARSAVGCVKRGIPETGFVGKKKNLPFIWRGRGGGRASVCLPRVFSLYVLGAGMTGKLVKLGPNDNDHVFKPVVSNEGNMIKLSVKGRSFV